MRKMLFRIGIVIGMVLIGALISWAFSFGLKKHEKWECERWKDWEGRSNYYLVRWQFEQCASYGIFLEADLKNY